MVLLALLVVFRPPNHHWRMRARQRARGKTCAKAAAQNRRSNHTLWKCPNPAGAPHGRKRGDAGTELNSRAYGRSEAKLLVPLIRECSEDLIRRAWAATREWSRPRARVPRSLPARPCSTPSARWIWCTRPSAAHHGCVLSRAWHACVATSQHPCERQHGPRHPLEFDAVG